MNRLRVNGKWLMALSAAPLLMVMTAVQVAAAPLGEPLTLNSAPSVTSIVFDPPYVTKGRASVVTVTVTIHDDQGIDRFHLLRVADCPPSGIYDEFGMQRQSTTVTQTGVEEVWQGTVSFPALKPDGPRKVLVEAFDGDANRLFWWSPCAYLPAQEPSLETPSPPLLVSALPSERSASVSWARPVSDGGSPITGFTVTASPGGQTCSTTGVLTCTITGLTNGTAYTFTVTATNSAGTSLPSAPSAPVTPTEPISNPTEPISKASKVVDLALKFQKRRIIVTWSPPANLGGADSVSYQYRVNKKKWVNTDRTRIVVRGKPGQRITVRVRAVNEAGFGPVTRVVGRPR